MESFVAHAVLRFRPLRSNWDFVRLTIATGYDLSNILCPVEFLNAVYLSVYVSATCSWRGRDERLLFLPSPHLIVSWIWLVAVCWDLSARAFPFLHSR